MTNRTKPTERIAGGQCPVEVRWRLAGDPTIHKTTFWCVHLQEAIDFLEWTKISHLQLGGFRAEEFVITPEMRIISAENIGPLSTALRERV